MPDTAGGMAEVTQARRQDGGQARGRPAGEQHLRVERGEFAGEVSRGESGGVKQAELRGEGAELSEHRIGIKAGLFDRREDGEEGGNRWHGGKGGGSEIQPELAALLLINFGPGLPVAEPGGGIGARAVALERLVKRR